MDSIAIKRYKNWLRDSNICQATKDELKSIKHNKNEIEDRFYKELEFGTAGLRGVIGAGTNRMNKYTVRKATQGLADYIKSQGNESISKGVVIAYDSRRMSREFTEEAALVLGANGIKTYLFDSLRATPQLSYAIRYLGCIAGIVITASHNPPEYNGYKVYWEDGAQIATDRARAIIESIDKIKDFGSIKIIEMKEAVNKGLVIYLDEKIDSTYINEVKKQSLRQYTVKKVSDDFKIVFTPLHGTGNVPVRRVLDEIGFENVIVVPEQELPNSEFPTVDYPNPEDKKAFELAIDLAKKEDANLIIGTDPDADRVGVVVKDNKGEYVVLTGNQTGALLVDYMLTALKEKDKLPKNGTVIKTIVTSELGANIAQSFNIETINVLTGFKYIGEKIKQFETNNDKAFLLGYEESYGYLAGTYARDKDAIVASMLICEMAAYHFSKGENLYDALLNLYKTYGYYYESLKSITLKGKEGLEQIAHIMNSFRKNPPTIVNGKKVIAIEDYKSGERVYLDKSKGTDKILLPKANVVKLLLDNNSWVTLRPSGTEPKLKIYVAVKEDSLEESRKELMGTIKWMESTISSLYR